MQTETAIVDLLRELRREGRLMLVSTHNLGSVPEFCDQVVLINRTVLAYGPTSEVFTEQNLTAVLQALGRMPHQDVLDFGRQVPALSDVYREVTA